MTRSAVGGAGVLMCNVGSLGTAATGSSRPVTTATSAELKFEQLDNFGEVTVLLLDNRADLEGNPDFVALAKAYGVPGKRVKRAADVDKALKWAMAYNDGPCLVEAEVVKEDNVFPMIPAGAPLTGMIIEKPKVKMDKPTGST